MGGNDTVTGKKRARALVRWLELAETEAQALDGLAKDLRTLPPSDASAYAVSELLGDSRLDLARDRAGRSLRALAVSTLLRMGYPWALRVAPDDLALMRTEERAASAPVLRWMNAVLALGPFIVAAAVVSGIALLKVGTVGASMVLIALCSAATAASMWMGTFSSRRRDGFRAAAGVAILSCLSEWAWGIAMGGLDLMMVGSLPVAVCALLATTTSVVTPAPLDA